MSLIARVAVEKTTLRFDRLFDYLVPERFQATLQIGCRVSVPFGAANQYRQGVVLDLIREHSEYQLKSVAEQFDQEPLLSAEMLDLVHFLVGHTFCTYYDAVRTILPAGYQYRVEQSFRVAVNLDAVQKDRFTDAQLELISRLRKAAGPKEVQQLLQACKESGQTDDLQALLDVGVVETFSSSKRRLGDKTMQMVRLADGGPEPEKLTPKQRRLLALIQDVGTASVKELCYLCGVTPIVVKNLVRRGLVELYDQPLYRQPAVMEPLQTETPVVLTSQQEKVVGQILAQCQHLPGVGLLHGVTGSGKTQVFVRLIEQMLQQHKQTILMVPEISLTPQMVQRFQGLFGQRVAVMHSSLSMGEQMDEYKRMKNGEAQIVIGTRSAVFAPFDRLGLIIMDEEGEATYKSSEMSPRYHAREVAKYRCVQHQALLLLASATPSIDSYYHASTGLYQLYELPERYGDAVLPQVSIIDLRQDPESMATGISLTLAQQLQQNLEHREQSILLLNRRGYQAIESCLDCGWVAECPHCSVGLTYHRVNHRLLCHYCGYSQPVPQICPQCGGKHLTMVGQGTQKIEEELGVLLPGARILRLDADTTITRGALEAKISRFAAGEYDILIGTQIVAKGLDFPNVTLVGVLSADSFLYGNDFQCHEHAFSMLTQVVGRSGRGGRSGRAYIQTYHPDHPVILQAARQDYCSFYRNEILERRALLYPPFCDLCVIGLSGLKEQEVDQCAKSFLSLLRDTAKQLPPDLPIRLLGRGKPAVYKLHNRYRQRIVLKCKNNAPFRRYIRKLLIFASSQKAFKNVQIYGDINGEIQ